MPRVHFVKSARKDNPVVKKGESYYWWSTRITVGKRYVSQKHRSKTEPKPSQLTSSDFLSQMYGFEEQIGEFSATSADDLRSEVESIAEEIRTLGEEQQEKLDNMPEGLQEGPTGQMLQERLDGCEAMADELEQVDFDDYEEGSEETEEEWLEGKLSEVQGVAYSGE